MKQGHHSYEHKEQPAGYIAIVILEFLAIHSLEQRDHISLKVIVPESILDSTGRAFNPIETGSCKNTHKEKKEVKVFLIMMHRQRWSVSPIQTCPYRRVGCI